MIYKIGICDNEISTCSELEEIITQYFKNQNDNIEIYVWNSAESFMKDVPNKINIDILFLDINVSDCDGLDVGQYIKNIIHNEVIQIIYISSEKRYEVDLFKVHPYDFLIKPVDRQRVCIDIQQLLHLSDQKNRFFNYVYNKRQHRILLKDILYFMSDKHHIKIMCIDKEEKYVGKLKDVLIKLPVNFARISQSYIINLEQVKECHSDEVVMTNGVCLKVSRNYKKVFNRKMIENN